MATQNDNALNIENITKIANVEVSLNAELGHTKISLKDAIEYDSGSTIKLDNNANEAINIYVDDVLIAKGQIVAIDKNYGVKITEIIENIELEKKQNANI